MRANDVARFQHGVQIPAPGDPAQQQQSGQQGKATGKIRKDLNTALISRTIATLCVASLNAAIQMDQDQATTEAAMAETLKTLAKGWQP
jgi:hypothetical protein